MDIRYFGHSSFSIKTKTSHVVTDPFSSDIGIKFPKTAADIVTVSHQHSDHNYTKGIEGEPVILDWPGEYEIKSTSIVGFANYHDAEGGKTRGLNTSFRIQAEGITILHLGDLGHKLDDTAIEALGSIDILMVPVGGFYTIDPQTAFQVVKAIDPYIVIPMHYGHAKLNQKTFGSLAPLEEFVKLYGTGAAILQPKLSVKREDFATETGTKVVALDITS